MNSTKTPDENLLNAQLDFFMNAPHEEFDEYLTEIGANRVEMSNKAKDALDRALENYAKTKEAAEALASLTPGQQKIVAQKLGIRRNILTALREHRVDVASIPRHFLARLSIELAQTVEAIVKALDGPAPRALAGQYKSDEKPNITHQRVPFEQLLREASMSEEEISQLMRNSN